MNPKAVIPRIIHIHNRIHNIAAKKRRPKIAKIEDIQLEHAKAA